MKMKIGVPSAQIVREIIVLIAAVIALVTATIGLITALANTKAIERTKMDIAASARDIERNTVEVAALKKEAPAIFLKLIMPKLKIINIYLSDTKPQDVSNWIENDPAYRVLITSCFELLLYKNKRLKSGIPLDVINGKYKENLGYRAEDAVPPEEYNNLEMLKKAIYSTWEGSKHQPHPEKNFDDIVENIR